MNTSFSPRRSGTSKCCKQSEMLQIQQRPKKTTSLVFLFMGYALAGCASGPDILVDYDHDAPFGSYNTYNFMEGAGPDHDNYQSFFSKYVIEAVTIEMESRGYTKSDDPDLLINFNANLEESIKAGVPMCFSGYPFRAGETNPVTAKWDLRFLA
jgi:hypothetical protein